MAWFEDLAPCTYFGTTGLVAVGWLERGHTFTTGEVPDAVLERLVLFRQHPFPVLVMGSHSCTWCELGVEKPGRMRKRSRFDFGNHGADNLFIPGPDGRDFIAPELILHVIIAHHYAPPSEFLDAVMHGPDPGSSDFLARLERHAPTR